MRGVGLAALLAVVGLQGEAYAADLATPPVAAPAIFTWTGVYAGTVAGYGLAHGKATATCTTPGPALCDGFAPAAQVDARGFVGGGQAGVSIETPIGLLLGIEGDVAFTPLRAYTDTVGTTEPLGTGLPATSVAHVGQRIDGFGTLRGRMGYALGPALIYATGGLAVADVRLDANRTDDFGFGVLETVASPSPRWRTGFVVGGGLEYALSDHISAKLEGLYYDLGSRAVSAADPGGFDLVRGARVATDGTLVRAGLAYHFDELPGLGLLRGGLEPADAPVAGPPVFSLETGLRYFYSTGGYRKTLFDNVDHAQTNSRLTFADAGASAGESFFRLDHNPTGLFVKGYIGSGGFDGGHLHDEDFPAAIGTYSNTLSALKGGDLSYADMDLGYEFWRDEAVNLAGFVGYHYLAETMNTYGCTQTAGGAPCAAPGAVPASVKALSEDAIWNAVRVGGEVDVRLDRVEVTAEAAYLPYVALDGYDRHWLRPDINPLPEKGTGTGYQVEALAAYHVSPHFSIGAGGRYWFMQATGTANFPGYTPSPLKMQTERYGGFLQAAYTFAE